MGEWGCLLVVFVSLRRLRLPVVIGQPQYQPDAWREPLGRTAVIVLVSLNSEWWSPELLRLAAAEKVKVPRTSGTLQGWREGAELACRAHLSILHTQLLAFIKKRHEMIELTKKFTAILVAPIFAATVEIPVGVSICSACP